MSQIIPIHIIPSLREITNNLQKPLTCTLVTLENCISDFNVSLKEKMGKRSDDSFNQQPNKFISDGIDDVTFVSSENITFKIGEYKLNWYNLLSYLDKIKNIREQGNENPLFILSTHQHTLSEFFFSFKKKTNGSYGFMNSSCIEVTKKNDNTLDFKVIYTDNNARKKSKYTYISKENISDEPNKWTLLIIRHGEAYHNISEKQIKRNSQLTARGVEGSQGLYTFLNNEYLTKKKLKLENAHFISSPLDRAIESLIHTITPSDKCNAFKNKFSTMRKALYYPIPQKYIRDISGDFKLKIDKERNVLIIKDDFKSSIGKYMKDGTISISPYVKTSNKPSPKTEEIKLIHAIKDLDTINGGLKLKNTEENKMKEFKETMREVKDNSNDKSFDYKMDEIIKIVYSLSLNYTQDEKKNKDGWIECNGEDQTKLEGLIEKEKNTNSFIIKCLNKSFLNYDEQNKPIFHENKHINGTSTEIDYDSIIFKGEYKHKDQKKLIMGFGPSASGKTHMSSKVIRLLNELYPEVFEKDYYISIDGGIYRECSIIYNAIHQAAKICGLSGITNLAKMFKTESVKKNVMEYLNHFKNLQKKIFNLYVPETLVSCNYSSSGCDDLIDIYKTYTGDNEYWTALHIYQCYYGGKKCQQSERNYQCEGIKGSVLKRQDTEGKIASSHAFPLRTLGIDSYNFGNSQAEKFLMKTKGIRFKIHNVGRADGSSILYDKTNYADMFFFKILQFNQETKNILSKQQIEYKDSFKDPTFKDPTFKKLKKTVKNARNGIKSFGRTRKNQTNLLTNVHKSLEQGLKKRNEAIKNSQMTFNPLLK